MLRIKTFQIAASFLFVIAFLTAVAGLCAASPSAEKLLKRKGFVWRTTASEHFRFHYESNDWTEKRIESLKRSQEQAHVKNLQLLKAGDFPHQTDVFVVASRERMKELIGEETNGVAYADTKVVCLIYNERLYAWGAHELMHVMAGNLWGRKPGMWINEGLATYSDDRWHGFGLHDLNKYLWQRKMTVPLEKLIEDFSGYSDMVTYPQAGSLVKYLYERYGAEKVRELWSSGTVKDLERVTGKDVLTLEKEWQSRLTEADASNIEYEFSPKR